MSYLDEFFLTWFEPEGVVINVKLNRIRTELSLAEAAAALASHICSGGSRIFQMGGRCFVANGGAHILFSGKKCMKLKEIGLKWGGARLLAPCYSKITIFL